jgi:hypothetical protein
MMKPTARTEDLIVEPLNGEVIVYDLRTDHAHLLDRTTAAVWNACDGTCHVAGLAAALSLDVDIVQLALRELQQANLLTEDLPPASVGTLSRRELVKRVAATAAAGAALPLIQTVVAPTPAMATSHTPCPGTRPFC